MSDHADALGIFIDVAIESDFSRVVMDYKSYKELKRHTEKYLSLLSRLGQPAIDALMSGEIVTMGYLLKIVGEASIEAGGLITWEQGVRAIRKKCEIIHKPQKQE